MRDLAPVCPECGGPMHLESTRKAMGLLGPSLAPDPTRLEASAIDLLALARFAEQDRFLAWNSVEPLDETLRWQAGGERASIDALFADLVAGHQTLRHALASEWSFGQTPVEELHARFMAALLGLREAILADPPAYLQVVRRLLAETQADNVVRLVPRRGP